MTDRRIINLLIVDRSLGDIEHIAQILRSTGHGVQLQHTDQIAKINDFITGSSLDLIMARQGENLPSIAEIRARIEAASSEIPLIVIVDDQTLQSPAELLQAGADNLFRLDDPAHLLQVVDKELRNLRARRDAQAYGVRLQESEQRFRILLDDCRDAIAYVHEGAHIFANPAYLELFGYASEEELEGITLMNMVPRTDRDKLKAFLRRAGQTDDRSEPIRLTGLHSDGSTFPIRIEGVPTRIQGEPSLQIAVSGVEDAEQQESLRKKIEETKKLDLSTGLYNRKAFIDHLDQRLKKGARGAVLYVLLTNIRPLGVEAAERLTVDVSELLRELLPEGDVLARFSDFVFTIHTSLTDRDALLDLAERIRKAVEEHATEVAHTLITTTACVGVCLIRAEYENAIALLDDANRACETARQSGGNQVQLYRPAAKASQAEREQAYTQQIRDALDRERLLLLFQPIASLNGDTRERYKARLQILDEYQNALPMTEAEPVAERLGMAYSLDKWTIMRCLELLTQRYQLGSGTAVLFIRVSGNSVTANDFVKWLEKRIRDTGLPGSLLVFEVTEEYAEHHFTETRHLREQLRALGCGFALSRFGDKPNSERILNHLVPDYIKLNSALIEKATRNREDALRARITKLTEQAREQNISIIADDVAHAPQMTAIWQFGIPLVQGDLVNPPSPQLDFNFQLFAG